MPKHFRYDRLKIDIGLLHSKFDYLLYYYNSKPTPVSSSSGITMKSPDGKITEIDVKKENLKRRSEISESFPEGSKKLKQVSNKRMRDLPDNLSSQFKKQCVIKTNISNINSININSNSNKRCAINQLERPSQKPKVLQWIS